MNDHKNADVHNGIVACEPVLLCAFESRYDDLLQDGKSQLAIMPLKSFGYDELRRMVNRLDKHKDHYLLFIRNYEAPFTNNLRQNAIYAIAKPDRKFQDASVAAGMVSWIIVKFV